MQFVNLHCIWIYTVAGLSCRLLRALANLLPSVLRSRESVDPTLAEVPSSSGPGTAGAGGFGAAGACTQGLRWHLSSMQ